MKKITLLFAWLICFTSVQAQQISPSTANSGGGSYTSGSLVFEWSTGESFVHSSIGTAIITAGILQPLQTGAASPLPITGLIFNAKRTSRSTVQLEWKTIQEIRNKGFYIERKRDNESSYTVVAFNHSKDLNGNSTTPLDYNWQDLNSYSGTTLYRLKQEDLDGKFSYSPIRSVNGEIITIVILKTWPNPSQGDLQVLLQGNKKEILLVYDLAGRMLQQVPITENNPAVIKHMTPGTYIIRLANKPEISQKIIFQ